MLSSNESKHQAIKSGAISTMAAEVNSFRRSLHSIVLWSRCVWTYAYESVAIPVNGIQICFEMSLLASSSTIKSDNINSSTWCECERVRAFIMVIFDVKPRSLTLTHIYITSKRKRIGIIYYDWMNGSQRFNILLCMCCVYILLKFQIWQLLIFCTRFWAFAS